MPERPDSARSVRRFGPVAWIALAVGLFAGFVFGPLGCIVAAVSWFAGYISGVYEAGGFS